MAWHQSFDGQARVVPGALGAIPAVFGAPARLDGKQGAQLHLIFGPVGLMYFSRLFEQVKKWQVVETVKFGVQHGKSMGKNVRVMAVAEWSDRRRVTATNGRSPGEAKHGR